MMSSEVFLRIMTGHYCAYRIVYLPADFTAS